MCTIFRKLTIVLVWERVKKLKFVGEKDNNRQLFVAKER